MTYWYSVKQTDRLWYMGQSRDLRADRDFLGYLLLLESDLLEMCYDDNIYLGVF